jgi:hypothetical protein
MWTEACGPHHGPEPAWFRTEVEYIYLRRPMSVESAVVDNSGANHILLARAELSHAMTSSCDMLRQMAMKWLARLLVGLRMHA